MPVTLVPRSHEVETLERRNRRTALVLMGWIVLLIIASIMVIWIRN